MSNVDIGHNNPPEVLDLASGVIRDVNLWMAHNPVIETEEAAKEAKLQIDRAKLCMRDLEVERRGKTDPLNSEVESIIARYRKPRCMLGDLLDEMLGRLKVFIDYEEARRTRLAAEAEARLRAAEEIAREAERLEREKLDDAAQGEIGVDLAEAIELADDAFEHYAAAKREHIRAEKDIPVKIRGGLSRSIGLKKVETLHIENPVAAIGEMGVTEDIAFAILKAARAYRRIHGRLPKGIIAKTETGL